MTKIFIFCLYYLAFVGSIFLILNRTKLRAQTNIAIFLCSWHKLLTLFFIQTYLFRQFCNRKQQLSLFSFYARIILYTNKYLVRFVHSYTIFYNNTDLCLAYRHIVTTFLCPQLLLLLLLPYICLVFFCCIDKWIYCTYSL